MCYAEGFELDLEGGFEIDVRFGVGGFVARMHGRVDVDRTWRVDYVV